MADHPDRSDILAKPERPAPGAAVIDPVAPEAPYVIQPVAPFVPPIIGAPSPTISGQAGPSTDKIIDARKLVVGLGTSLSGHIGSCNTLIVEGNVEANLKEAKNVVVGETGIFRGSAVIDEAEIRGRLEGELIVRKRLRIHATGFVSGTVTYKEIEVEFGGKISGILQAPA